VVECTSDPEKLGRVKVRVLGDHTQDKIAIPTDSLPWAMPMMPVTSPSMNGIGQSPIGLLQGSWVFGFYRDGQDKQQPIIIGSVGGIPLDAPSSSIGFNDPVECFPQTSKLNEPDTNRHARGVVGKHVKEPVPVTIRRENILSQVTTATMQWSEPVTPYAPIYPYNHVWEGSYNPTCDGCEWGHIEEWDSTPGSERYFRSHKTSQNFLEIHPDGKEVRKIFGDGFEIDLMNKHLYVEGDYRVTIKGNKDEHIKGDYLQHIEGDYIRVVDGVKSVITRGNDSTSCYSDIVRKSKGSTLDATEKNHIRLVNGNIKDSSGGKITSISAQENTRGTGSYSPMKIDVISPVVVSSEGYSSIVLSCSVANGTKGPLSDLLIPSIPSQINTVNGVAVTQSKITPGVIFHDAQDIHCLGISYFKGPANFNDSVIITGSMSVMGGMSTGGDASISGTLYANSPTAIDPEGNHPYIVPTPPPGPSPSPSSLAVVPTKSSISDSISLSPKTYEVTEIESSQTIPGIIHICG
jgi:hypothetical protein